ncbi:RIO1 family regulatory kinase/ATPase [Tersicoccus sp. MR15.9]|uniref:RIO1 family regulatory kinase/ATPase domain-containing protein n=1 Tax=Tersicoccus mangrovi TaxID=3121635 RepID=UPI002FE53259
MSWSSDPHADPHRTTDPQQVPDLRHFSELRHFAGLTLSFDDDTGDDLAPGRRWSTFNDVERGCRGPDPRPDWVIEDAAAVDTELGVLKTGKEADVFLLERATAHASCLLAAKRYRAAEHRQFHRSTVYTEGRTTRRSRDARALETGSTFGRSVAAAQWAGAEWAALRLLYTEGLPVPYPVQLDGTELLLEFVPDVDDPDGVTAAPRLQQASVPAGSGGTDLLWDWWHQTRDVLLALARLGLAHGDLSPYNVLASGRRLVVIDVPQIVDTVSNPRGAELLARDCTTMARWFVTHGLPVDPDALVAQVLAELR